jgi:hypothetical protein
MFSMKDIVFGRDRVERRSCNAKKCGCPRCGKRGRRIRTYTRVIRHIAYEQVAWIIVEQGEYVAKCDCCKTFRAPIPGVPQRGHYSWGVRMAVIKGLLRDRLPEPKLKERLNEDFLLEVSSGYIYDCFEAVSAMVNQEGYWAWAKEKFSGVMCIDEVHDGKKRKILFATDPLNDFTVAFRVVPENSQEHMNAFLDEIKAHGIEPKVVITDGSPLYKDALAERWVDVEHQLCIFHVLKDINKLVLDAVRAVKNRLKRQGKKGRKPKRGRKRKGSAKKKKRVTRKEQASFIFDHQHLIVKKKESLTEEDRENLKKLFDIASELREIRRFVEKLYRLFEKGSTKEKARRRRRALVNDPAFQQNEYLVRAIRKIAKDKFEKMIVFMGYTNIDRTSNHVERNNRSFRMMQKTRYKRRRKHTVEAALWLELARRLEKHPLSQNVAPPIKLIDLPTNATAKSRRKAA